MRLRWNALLRAVTNALGRQVPSPRHQAGPGLDIPVARELNAPDGTTAGDGAPFITSHRATPRGLAPALVSAVAADFRPVHVHRSDHGPAS